LGKTTQGQSKWEDDTSRKTENQLKHNNGGGEKREENALRDQQRAFVAYGTENAEVPGFWPHGQKAALVVQKQRREMGWGGEKKRATTYTVGKPKTPTLKGREPLGLQIEGDTTLEAKEWET